MVKHRSATLMALPVLAALVLSGCGSGQKPTAAAAPTSSSATASASPTTSSASPTTSGPAIDPNIPAAARAHTPRGGEAFARYFFDQFNKSWQTANPVLLHPLSAAGCKTCAAFMATATSYRAAGQHYEGQPFSVEHVGALGPASATGLDLLVAGEQQAAAIVDSSGRAVRHTVHQSGQWSVQLGWTGRAWIVNKLQVFR